jgi:hypothetical protein
MSGDPANPKNRTWWSSQMRRLLGHATAVEFPDTLEADEILRNHSKCLRRRFYTLWAVSGLPPMGRLQGYKVLPKRTAVIPWTWKPHTVPIGAVTSP